MEKQMWKALTLAVLMSMSAASIQGQGTKERTAYVPDPSTSSLFPEDDKRLNKRLADAAAVFIEVRLNSLKDLRVQRSKSPCVNEVAGAPETAQPRTGESRAPSAAPEIDAADSYEVRTSIKTLGISGLETVEKELVLDYELVKYVKCKQTTLVHRSEPISEKTAFDSFLQMGNMLEVKLRNELEPPRINIDVAGISIQSESLQALRDDLINRLFVRLASESDFRVRDVRGGQSTSDVDYLVTGVLTKDTKGVRFTIRNVKDASKNQSTFIPAPPDQRAESLNAFYKTAVQSVVDYIRVCPLTSLTDDEVANALSRVSEVFCEGCKPDPDQVTQAIFQLTRLNCTNKTSTSLTLLGNAYSAVGDFLKAADAYEQAVKMLPPDRTDDIVRITIQAGDAWYQAQNYGNAALRYELAIAKAPELQPPREGAYLQRARSYRFAADKKAFAAALDGLIKYPTSAELAAEVSLAFNTLPITESRSAYDSILKNSNLDALTKVLPNIQKKLAENLLEDVFDKSFDKKNLNEVEQLLKLVEILPTGSLQPEYLDAYKIMRAIWQRDAKNDFDNAVTVLTPYSEQTAEIGEVARYFLAHTYYERARRANNKADYEKSIPLFKRAIEKDLFFDDDRLYPYLALANHMLGRDQDTRSFLEQILQKASRVNASEALVSLCLNYLQDLECADKNTQTLEAGLSSKDGKVHRLELHVLHAEYHEAEKLLVSLASPTSNPNEVTLFYQVWTLYALERDRDAQAALRRWQSRMQSVRSSDESMRWVFDAANRALDAEAKLSTPQKDRLRSMIGAMVDNTRPLPN